MFNQSKKPQSASSGPVMKKAGEEKSLPGKVKDAVGSAANSTKDAIGSVAISTKNVIGKGAQATRKQAAKMGEAAKDKWDDLDENQRKAIKIAGGGVLALLVLKRLVFGRKKKEGEAYMATGSSGMLGGGNLMNSREFNSTPQKGGTSPGPFSPGSSGYRGPREIPIKDRFTAAGGDFEGGDFSILSYNTLADIFATTKRHPYVFNRYLQWDYRFQLLLNEIKTADTDIVCLQEVDPIKFYDWRRAMRLMGYEGVVQERAKTGGTFIACATFWKMDRAKLVTAEHRTRALVTALALANNRRVLVANVHLEGNPLRPQDRISQIRNVLAVINKMKGDLDVDGQFSSVAVAGDFNSERDSTVYRLLTAGRLEAGATEPIMPGIPVTEKTIAHPFKFKDVYAEAKASQAFTRKVPGMTQTIDYILVSDDLVVRAVNKTMTAKERSHAQKHYLPNRHQPSDHVPLGVLLG